MQCELRNSLLSSTTEPAESTAVKKGLQLRGRLQQQGSRKQLVESECMSLVPRIAITVTTVVDKKTSSSSKTCILNCKSEHYWLEHHCYLKNKPNVTFKVKISKFVHFVKTENTTLFTHTVNKHFHLPSLPNRDGQPSTGT